MKKNTKRLTAAASAAVMAVVVMTAGLTNAFATKNADDTYTPSQGVQAKTYYFALPGFWQNDYWRQNEDCAGIYWQAGADVPGSVFIHDYPGYKMQKETEECVDNLYCSPVPANAEQIIINNHIDGGMPGDAGFVQERFDSACQTTDVSARYDAFMESPYYSKALRKYVWDKAADAADMDRVEWSDDETELTDEENRQIEAICEVLTDDEIELEIPAFGKYSKSFYVDTESWDGIVQSFDNMVYVVNPDPDTMTVSATIVPDGKIAYGGDWFFYYGKGEFGIWPTKELLTEYTGITFDDDGTPVLPEDGDLLLDSFGMVNKRIATKDGTQNLMVAGNFTGKYSEIATLDVPSISGGDPAPDKPSIGDVNGDGAVTIDDVTMVQKAVAELVVLTAGQTAAADANGDGRVSISDATQIQRFIAELIDRLG